MNQIHDERTITIMEMSSEEFEAMELEDSVQPSPSMIQGAAQNNFLSEGSAFLQEYTGGIAVTAVTTATIVTIATTTATTTAFPSLTSAAATVDSRPLRIAPNIHLQRETGKQSCPIPRPSRNNNHYGKRNKQSCPILRPPRNKHNGKHD